MTHNTISDRKPGEYHPLELENTKLRHINISQIAEIARLNSIIRELEATQAWNKKCDEEEEEDKG